MPRKSSDGKKDIRFPVDQRLKTGSCAKFLKYLSAGTLDTVWWADSWVDYIPWYAHEWVIQTILPTFDGLMTNLSSPDLSMYVTDPSPALSPPSIQPTSKALP
jgi:hypothetical protein